MKWFFVMMVACGLTVTALAVLSKPSQSLESFRFTFPDGRVLSGQAPIEQGTWLRHGDVLVPKGVGRASIWNNRTVIYGFAFDLPAGLRHQALAAMRVWSNATPIRFQARTTQAAYVLIDSKRDACFAATGFHNLVQPMNLGQSCSFFQVLHQFGHAMGLQHNHASNVAHALVHQLYK